MELLTSLKSIALSVACFCMRSNVRKLVSNSSGKPPRYFALNAASFCSFSSNRFFVFSNSESRNSLVPMAWASRTLRFSSIKYDARVFAIRITRWGSLPVKEMEKDSAPCLARSVLTFIRFLNPLIFSSWYMPVLSSYKPNWSMICSRLLRLRTCWEMVLIRWLISEDTTDLI